LLGDAGAGSVSEIVTTTTKTTYPTIAAAYYAVQPCRLDGAETEGTGASFSGDSSRIFYAFNLGTQVPPVSTQVLVHSVGGRWVFRYDG
jgi:hypothetical protein